jgi:hypothetical protein
MKISLDGQIRVGALAHNPSWKIRTRLAIFVARDYRAAS